MTPRTDPAPLFPPTASHARVPARDTRAVRARRPGAPALCAAMLCAGGLWADVSHARTPRAPRAASSPSTAQILAPSAATVPDALPLDRAIYRGGNSYSPRACGDAQTRPLDVADPRTDTQRRQAEDIAARDKRLAAWLETGRHERDKVASAPATGRLARAATDCAETTAAACKPKKARLRHAVSKAPKAASGAADSRR